MYLWPPDGSFRSVSNSFWIHGSSSKSRIWGSASIFSMFCWSACDCCLGSVLLCTEMSTPSGGILVKTSLCCGEPSSWTGRLFCASSLLERFVKCSPVQEWRKRRFLHQQENFNYPKLKSVFFYLKIFPGVSVIKYSSS